MKMVFAFSLLLSISFQSLAQDTLKVYFLYGSKPKRAHKATEAKWFGGKHGGHVGLALNNENILHFLPQYSTQIFSRKIFRSRFVVTDASAFWKVLGSCDSVKKLIVNIPVTREIVKEYQKIKNEYLEETPYDYALFGFRCASASAEILSRLELLEKRNDFRLKYGYFYPRRLRKKLENIFLECRLSTVEGTKSRNWEK